MAAVTKESPQRRLLRLRAMGRSFASSALFHLLVVAVISVITVTRVPRATSPIFLGVIRSERQAASLATVSIEPLPPQVGEGGETTWQLPTDSDVSPYPDIGSKLTQGEGLIAAPDGSPLEGLRRIANPIGQLGASLDRPLSGAEFFGVRSQGRRFVFLVDCSLSMRGPRWDAACQELTDAVRQLGGDQLFYVVFFDIDPHPMFGDADIARNLVPATAENVERLEKWFRTIELGYQTEPWPAVQMALELEPDAIYLLSDGEFSPMTRERLSLLNYRLVDDRQVRPAVVVNTFAMHGREGANNLRAIARENGGEYRFVFVATPGGLGPVRRSVALPANQAPAADALLRVGAKLEGNELGQVRRVVYSSGDEGMSSVRRLEDVRELWLANSYVTDEGLRAAQNLPSLEVLILSNAYITDESAYTISQMKQLRALFLEGTEITEQGMERIVRLPQLRVLSTPGTLTDRGLQPLEQLENLEVLYLHEPQVTDAGMEVIARLVRLRELSLQGTRITDHGLPALRTLSQLEILRIDGTRVSDRAIECFKQWPLLSLLGIRDTLIGPAAEQRLRTELPGLRLEK